jgi:AcrR family transcriptional regulator
MRNGTVAFRINVNDHATEAHGVSTANQALCDAPDAAVRAGRPIDHTRDAAILAATRELICEVGYDRLTVEAVALRAHAGKATLYRRWPSKAALVLDAMRERHDDVAALPDTGELRSDLIEALSLLATRLAETDCALVGGLMTAMRTDAELEASWPRARTPTCCRTSSSRSSCYGCRRTRCPWTAST